MRGRSNPAFGRRVRRSPVRRERRVRRVGGTGWLVHQSLPPYAVVARWSPSSLHRELPAAWQAVMWRAPSGFVAAAAPYVMVAGRHVVVEGPPDRAMERCSAAARYVVRAAGAGDASRKVNDATFSGLVASGHAGRATANLDYAQRFSGMARPSQDAPLRQIQDGLRPDDIITRLALASGFRRDNRGCTPLRLARGALSSLRRTVSATASADDGTHAPRAGARTGDMAAGKANGGSKSPLHSTRTFHARGSRPHGVPVA